MVKFKRVIVVTGTPGTGKTTVSKLLASKLKALHVDLGKLVAEEKLFSGRDEVRGSLVADMPRAVKRVAEIIRKTKGYVIVDGHYAADIVPSNLISVAFVLRCDPDELRRRLEGMGLRGKKVSENVAAEILDVCLWDAVSAYRAKKVCEIDTSGRSPKEVMNEVLSVLQGKETLEIKKVDWLGKLDREGRVEDFLGG